MAGYWLYIQVAWVSGISWGWGERGKIEVKKGESERREKRVQINSDLRDIGHSFPSKQRCNTHNLSVTNNIKDLFELLLFYRSETTRLFKLSDQGWSNIFLRRLMVLWSRLWFKTRSCFSRLLFSFGVPLLLPWRVDWRLYWHSIDLTFSSGFENSVLKDERAALIGSLGDPSW